MRPLRPGFDCNKRNVNLASIKATVAKEHTCLTTVNAMSGQHLLSSHPRFSLRKLDNSGICSALKRWQMNRWSHCCRIRYGMVVSSLVSEEKEAIESRGWGQHLLSRVYIPYFRRFHRWIHYLVCTIATDSDLTRCNALDIIELRCLISIASKARGQRISEDALSHCNMRLADRKDFRPQFSRVRKSGAYFNVTSATWKCSHVPGRIHVLYKALPPPEFKSFQHDTESVKQIMTQGYSHYAPMLLTRPIACSHSALRQRSSQQRSLNPSSQLLD